MRATISDNADSPIKRVFNSEAEMKDLEDTRDNYEHTLNMLNVGFAFAFFRILTTYDHPLDDVFH